MLFDVPKGWVWCTLDDLAYVAAGSTPNKDAFVAKGIPYIKMYNLRMQKIDFDFHPQYIKREIHEGKLHRSRTEIGDLLMNIVGPPLVKLAVIPSTLPEGNFNQAAVLIRPYHHKELLVKYLFYYLSEMSEINSISTKGSAGQVNISLTQSQNMRIPLPPLAEQQRIVEEIERWFKLIDIVEQGKTDLQSTIKQAKNKILDLAIHGKLVPQDPNDEPASELLKRVNPKAEITCDNGHYPKLPSTWRVCSYKDIFTTISSRPFQIKQSEIKDKGKYPVVSQSLSYIEGYSNIECALKCDSSYIVFGDHTRIVKFIDFDFIVGADGVKIITSKINNKYAYFLLLYVSDKINNKGYSRHFSQIINYKYSLPPFAEQQRIVEKIDKLFSILNTIEESL